MLLMLYGKVLRLLSLNISLICFPILNILSSRYTMCECLYVNIENTFSTQEKKAIMYACAVVLLCVYTTACFICVIYITEMYKLDCILSSVIEFNYHE